MLSLSQVVLLSSESFWLLFLVGFVTLIICYYFELFCLKNKSNDNISASQRIFSSVRRQSHMDRRYNTYPYPVPNSWYHICDSDEVKSGGKPIYIRAIGCNFVVWRTLSGEIICMDAYCPHMGANLGLKSRIVNNCIECPFHNWRFDSNGNLVKVPYLSKDKKLPKCKSIPKYICKDWCGLVMVYFNAEQDIRNPNNVPEFDLPSVVQEELNNGWIFHKRSDIGHVELTPIDWVDQSGDHSHFHTLHNTITYPYSSKPLPKFITSRLDIDHSLKTVLGDKWDTDKHGPIQKYYGHKCKYYIYFMDTACLRWKKKKLPFTISTTQEFYVGPALMIFNIPLAHLGSMKIFVSITPTLGKNGNNAGSIMRFRVWLSNNSWKLYMYSWIAGGVAVGQLLCDIEILTNRIRKKKPVPIKPDGPYNKVNAWLKQFYSQNSCKVGTKSLDVNDW